MFKLLQEFCHTQMDTEWCSKLQNLTPFKNSCFIFKLVYCFDSGGFLQDICFSPMYRSSAFIHKFHWFTIVLKSNEVHFIIHVMFIIITSVVCICSSCYFCWLAKLFSFPAPFHVNTNLDFLCISDWVEAYKT